MLTLPLSSSPALQPNSRRSGDYYLTRPGLTEFPFKFPTLPSHLASSCRLGSNGVRHYEITARIYLRAGPGEPGCIAEVAELELVEEWKDFDYSGENEVFGAKIKKIASEGVKNGAGKITLHGIIDGSSPSEGGSNGRLYWREEKEERFEGNEEIEVRVKIKNGGKRSVGPFVLITHPSHTYFQFQNYWTDLWSKNNYLSSFETAHGLHLVSFTPPSCTPGHRSSSY
jgi:hypothetical protein